MPFEEKQLIQLKCYNKVNAFTQKDAKDPTTEAIKITLLCQ